MDWEDESLQDKVFRLFGTKIFHLACNLDPHPESTLVKTDPHYRPSPAYTTIRSCRLVSTFWNDTISEALHNAEKPVLIIDPVSYFDKHGMNANPEGILKVIKILSEGREELNKSDFSDLSLPQLKLHLPSAFFYKEVENYFLHSWKSFEENLLEIQFDFPVDSSMSFEWPEINLSSLRKLHIKCTYDAKGVPFLTHGWPLNPENTNYMKFVQKILNGSKNLKSFAISCYNPTFVPNLGRLSLPAGIKHLDFPLINISAPEVERLKAENLNGDCKRVKQLTIRVLIHGFKNSDTGDFATFLVEKYRNSVEELELLVSGREIDFNNFLHMRTDVTKVEIKYPLKNLRRLWMYGANWEISGIQSYQVFPSLKQLVLLTISRKSQIEAFYKSRSDTVQVLALSFYDGMMPPDVILGFSENLPRLRELGVVLQETGEQLQTCVYKFKMLKLLLIVYTGSTREASIDLLQSVITGIPVEEIEQLRRKEREIEEIMKVHGDSKSLRKLQDLEDFQLTIMGRVDAKIDASLMLQTTFFRMPKLKRLILSERTLEISETYKDSIQTENRYGLNIKWK